MASLTLIGVPFSLGWITRVTLFTEILRVDGVALVVVAVVAGGLALSGLADYWLLLSRGHESNLSRSVVGLVAMIPFLTPGLAPFVLFALTGANAISPDLSQPAGVWAGILGSVLLAGGLAYFKSDLVATLPLSTHTLSAGLRFNWLLPYADTIFNNLSKVALRLQIILEGQHYLGWAMFTALVGLLIILFS
jgi:outer membrane murein-binding lipoprotein Lpp